MDNDSELKGQKKRRIEILDQQWHNQDDGALLMYAFSFLDVKTLLLKESVNKTWQKLCEDTIHAKCGEHGPKPFQSKQELKDAVEKYCTQTATDTEQIACTYGYPIDKTLGLGMCPA
jgi:hypothetical protein